jgi:hypothetical protein
VMMAVAAFKRQPGRVVLVKTGATGGKLKPGPPPKCYLEAALDYLVEDAQRNMNLEGMASLEAEEVIREHEVGPPRRIKVVMARGERYLRVAYDAETLPILPHNHPLSRLLLQEAHAADHGGIESMTMRSRAHAWIVKAKKLAKSVKRGCFTCRRREKVRETQKMAPCRNTAWGRLLSLSPRQWISSVLSPFRTPSTKEEMERHGEWCSCAPPRL